MFEEDLQFILPSSKFLSEVIVVIFYFFVYSTLAEKFLRQFFCQNFQKKKIVTSINLSAGALRQA